MIHTFSTSYGECDKEKFSYKHVKPSSLQHWFRKDPKTNITSKLSYQKTSYYHFKCKEVFLMTT